jgi:hypothetical protein
VRRRRTGSSRWPTIAGEEKSIACALGLREMETRGVVKGQSHIEALSGVRWQQRRRHVPASGSEDNKGGSMEGRILRWPWYSITHHTRTVQWQKQAAGGSE